ncbi:MAG TPA: malic enzyme-like NAD(P)-binding protein, partial [Terriglobia bacterium]|nr:malic enzyme-like NAD(P)-binding protein [Terriglobia bacterium]
MALGILVVGAQRVTEAMFMAAGKAVAAASPTLADPKGKLLPPVSQLRDVAFSVARAVARQAQLDGVATFHDDSAIEARIAEYM